MHHLPEHIQWFIYNFGPIGPRLPVSHINESNCKIKSPEHYF